MEIQVQSAAPDGVAKLSLLIQFSYLQLLDVLTTLAFLMNGVKEANPIIRLALESGSSPLAVLVPVKLFALALGIYCLRSARLRLLARMNVFFAVLVAWNLVVLILSARMFAA